MAGRASKGPAARKGLPWENGGLQEPCQLSKETAGTADISAALLRRPGQGRGAEGPAGGCQRLAAALLLLITINTNALPAAWHC